MDCKSNVNQILTFKTVLKNLDRPAQKFFFHRFQLKSGLFHSREKSTILSSLRFEPRIDSDTLGFTV